MSQDRDVEGNGGGGYGPRLRLRVSHQSGLETRAFIGGGATAPESPMRTAEQQRPAWFQA
jgi:hypothetical protein